MRDHIIPRRRERRWPPIGLVVLGLASWAAMAFIAQIGFRLLAGA